MTVRVTALNQYLWKTGQHIDVSVAVVWVATLATCSPHACRNFHVQGKQ